MIYTHGDSHATTTFNDIENIKKNTVVERTMYATSQGKTSFIKNVKPKEYVIWCFGEIDVRCHIKKQERLGRNVDEVISSLVKDYVDHIIQTQKKYHYNCFIMSIVPPAYDGSKPNKAYPFEGTDEERKSYTIKLNALLEKACIKNNFKFFNVYDLYKDENGMLNRALSDGHVHIKDTTLVKDLLKSYSF